ncbi:unnamed protein product [Gadus morhua 'NCC']
MGGYGGGGEEGGGVGGGGRPWHSLCWAENKGRRSRGVGGFGSLGREFFKLFGGKGESAPGATGGGRREEQGREGWRQVDQGEREIEEERERERERGGGEGGYYYYLV